MKYLLNYQKNIKIALIMMLLGILSQEATAQYAFGVFGDNVKSEKAALSFTAGQCFYAFHSSSMMLISEGVQQPYEIQKTTGMKNFDIKQNFLVYPNPVQNTLTIEGKTEGNELEHSIARLFSIDGIEVCTVPMTGPQTMINTSDLQAGIYLLKIYHPGMENKVIKIIKK